MTPFWKVFYFSEYMSRRTAAIFFDHPAAVAFTSEHGREYSVNGCYISAFYPKRKSA